MFPARTAAFQGLTHPSRRRTQRRRILILITSLILNAEANGARYVAGLTPPEAAASNRQPIARLVDASAVYGPV